jgi:hypothetical protein
MGAVKSMGPASVSSTFMVAMAWIMASLSSRSRCTDRTATTSTTHAALEHEPHRDQVAHARRIPAIELGQSPSFVSAGRTPGGVRQESARGVSTGLEVGAMMGACFNACAVMLHRIRGWSIS